MKKKLIVSGCSITHGAETYNGFMHPKNIENSYSNHLSALLGTDLENIALSGASNHYIFHSTIEAIAAVKDKSQIHSVIVAWTSPERLYWKNKDRHWFFIPGWASSMQDLVNWPFHDAKNSAAFITGDSDSIVAVLEDQHKFFVDNYLDDRIYLRQQTKNYSDALNAYASINNTRLIELSAQGDIGFRFDPDGSWRKLPRHPTRDEHVGIANELFLKFYQ